MSIWTVLTGTLAISRARFLQSHRTSFPFLSGPLEELGDGAGTLRSCLLNARKRGFYFIFVTTLIGG